MGYSFFVVGFSIWKYKSKRTADNYTLSYMATEGIFHLTRQKYDPLGVYLIEIRFRTLLSI